MNILQVENLVKGLPDDRLFQEAKQPSGQIPQFMAVSEIKRRTEMRNAQKQQQVPQPTVTDQIVNQGIAAVRPQQMPMPPQQPLETRHQMAGGGIVRLATGGGIMAYGGPNFTVPYEGKLYQISSNGYRSQLDAFQAFLAGRNPPVSVSGGGEGMDMNARFSPEGSLLGDPTAPMPATPPSLGAGPKPGYMWDGQTAIPEQSGIASVAPDAGFDWGGIGLSVADAARKLPGRAKDLILPGQMGEDYDTFMAGVSSRPLDVRQNMANAYDVWKHPVGALATSLGGYASDMWTGGKELARGVADQFGFDVGKGPFTGDMTDIQSLEMLGEMMGDRPFTMEEYQRGLAKLGEAGYDFQAIQNAGLSYADVASYGKDQPAGGGIADLTPEPEAFVPEENMSIGTPSILDRIARDGGDPGQVTSAEGASIQSGLNGEILQRFLNKVGTASPAPPDISDLIEATNRDAYSNALIQIGSGIAGNDLSGGIARAGEVAMAGKQQARALDLQNRMLGYRGQMADLDRDVGILGRAAQIEATSQALTKELKRQNALDRRNIIATARQMVTEAYKQNVSFFEDPSQALAAMEADFNRLVEQMFIDAGLTDEKIPELTAGADVSDTSGFKAVRRK